MLFQHNAFIYNLNNLIEALIIMQFIECCIEYFVINR